MEVANLIGIEEVVEKQIEKHLQKTGLILQVQSIKKVIDSTEAAFRLLEMHPHIYSKGLSCQTCNAVSALIGRNFGCRNIR